ncbi:MAG: SRPBCC family protein [Acidobacteriota bacterium]
MTTEEETFTAGTEIRLAQDGGINVGKAERIVSAIIGGALVAYGLKERTPLTLAFALGGCGLLYRGASGECQLYRTLGVDTSDRASGTNHVARDFHVEKSITINSSPAELFNFWRKLENLPRFMEGLESVTQMGGNRSHWVAQGPGGTKVEWDAEIFNEIENELIAWRSLSHADVDNAGSVRFESAAGGRGTRVSVNLNYNAPGGTVGVLITKLFGREPGQLVEENLRRLKQLIETGEIPTTEGQPSGRTGDPLAASSRSKEKSSAIRTEEPLKTREATASGAGGIR